MAIPKGECPPGLEILAQIDQCVEIFEAFTGFETANKYEIMNSHGQRIYFAAEESGCCCRQCCGTRRSFELHIIENSQKEVITVRRPFKCCVNCCCSIPCASCCPCVADALTIEAPPGNPIGTVRQVSACCNPDFGIYDAGGQRELKVKSPCCICCPMCGVKFEVLALNGQKIGAIQKKFSGLGKEMFTDADNFGITFPMDLDVSSKACLLAATFLIDFIFFEDKSGAAEKH